MLVRGSGLKSVASQPASQKLKAGQFIVSDRTSYRKNSQESSRYERIRGEGIARLACKCIPLTIGGFRSIFMLEDWTCLIVSCSIVAATRPMDSASVCYRTGFPQKCRGGNHTLIKYPFAVLILGTVFLGGFHASRAYQKQKRACPSHNPFLP